MCRSLTADLRSIISDGILLGLGEHIELGREGLFLFVGDSDIATFRFVPILKENQQFWNFSHMALGQSTTQTVPESGAWEILECMTPKHSYCKIPKIKCFIRIFPTCSGKVALWSSEQRDVLPLGTERASL